MRAHFLPDDKQIRLVKGKTLLHSAIKSKIPIAHACGGAGSCSTCRVWVLEGLDQLPPRTHVEEETAKRLGLETRVRLACQTVPDCDLKLRRLVLPETVQGWTRRAEKPGEEKELVILFSDLRDFTPFAEKLPPHDVIFILDRFFSQMGEIITKYGGMIQNYMGDGFLAVFGQDNDAAAPLNSIRAAWEMQRSMDDFRIFLEANFGKSLRMGLGLHQGPVVVGTVGYGGSRRLTVIGDTVNTASRIESATKAAGVEILLSEDLYTQVKHVVQPGKRISAALKGKAGETALVEVAGVFSRVQDVDIAWTDEDGEKWHRLCRRNEPSFGKPYPILVLGERRLLVVRPGEATVIEERCPHMRLPLKNGKVTEDGAIQCPWHHSAFDLETGDVKAWAPWPPVVGPLLGAVRKKRVLKTWPALLREGYWWCRERERE